MKKSRSLSKQMQIMCINNKCTAWLNFVTVPAEKISYYKCPRCKGRMRKYSMNASIKLRMKENSQNEKLQTTNPQNNYETFAPLLVIPLIVFLYRKNPVNERSQSQAPPHHAHRLLLTFKTHKNTLYHGMRSVNDQSIFNSIYMCVPTIRLPPGIPDLYEGKS